MQTKKVIIGLCLFLFVVVLIFFGSLYSLPIASNHYLALIGYIITAVLLCIMALFSAHELIMLRSNRLHWPKWLYSLILLAILAMLIISLCELPFNLQNHNFIFNFLAFNIVDIFIILCILIIFTYFLRKIIKFSDITFLLFTIVLIVIMFKAFFLLMFLGGWSIILYILIICAITDSFAYLGGKKFGRHKLATKISPNKTIEGALIGFCTAGVFGILYGIIIWYIPIKFYIPHFYSNSIYQTFSFLPMHRSPGGMLFFLFLMLIISLGLSLIAQIGDLFFSFIKRRHNVKDFSNILSNHGGILDRLDSFGFSWMIYALLLVMCLFYL